MTWCPRMQGTAEQPLQALKPGAEVQVAVVGTYAAAGAHRGSRNLPELSGRTSALAAARAGTPPAPVTSFDALSAGDCVAGVVQHVAKDHLFVSLASAVRGRVALLHSADTPAALKALQKRFAVGTMVATRVVAVDRASQRLDLSLLGADFALLVRGGGPPRVRTHCLAFTHCHKDFAFVCWPVQSREWLLVGLERKRPPCWPCRLRCLVDVVAHRRCSGCSRERR